MMIKGIIITLLWQRYSDVISSIYLLKITLVICFLGFICISITIWIFKLVYMELNHLGRNLCHFSVLATTIRLITTHVMPLKSTR